MNTRTLAIITIALWVLTAAAVATRFIGGTTEPSADGRTAVVLPEAERAFVLMEMRQLLEAVHGIIGGVNAGDLEQVERVARASGAAAPRSAPAELMMRLPLGFKQTGMSVHQGLDEIADAAQNGESGQQIMERLHGQLGTCIGCHAAFRLTEQH